MNTENKVIEWRPIPGSIYNLEISNYGDIRSSGYCDSGSHYHQPFVEEHTDHTISEYGYRKRHVKGVSTYLVHRMVALAFLPQIDGKPHINHKDGNKLNNFVGTSANDYTDGNLEWCTPEENIHHAFDIGLNSKDRLQETIVVAVDVIKQPILQLDLHGNIIQQYDSLMDACRAIGAASFGDIARAARGEGKSAYGYQWVYVADYDSARQYVYAKQTTGKAVAQYSKNGELLAIYPSTLSAARAIRQRNGAHIAACCKGLRKHCGGFRWQWAQD